MPETSIIIVSHNELRETTAPCLESIFRNGAGGDFKVIVVDNDLSDEMPDYPRAVMERGPSLRCILNKCNRGSAGGNNDGLRIAVGKRHSRNQGMAGWVDQTSFRRPFNRSDRRGRDDLSTVKVTIEPEAMAEEIAKNIHRVRERGQVQQRAVSESFDRGKWVEAWGKVLRCCL